MATVKQCDRCKKVYHEAEGTRFGDLVFRNIRMISKNGYTIHDFDLCNDCLDHLLYWLGVNEELEPKGVEES